jgi:predicted RNase H-like nuclease
MAQYLGLDGFRFSWVAAWIDDPSGRQGFDYSACLEQLLRIPHKRAMIDIPIGLPDTGYRECDLKGREWLGSSVFLGARRSLLDFECLDEANSYYWEMEGRGRGISCQLWSLQCKIREVDAIVNPTRQRTLSETHPELVFWRRNGKKALKNKKIEAGRKQRIAILKKLGFSNVEKWLGLRYGTGIGRDDIIDACACAVAARDATVRIGKSERDAKGLRMEINF